MDNNNKVVMEVDTRLRLPNIPNLKPFQNHKRFVLIPQHPSLSTQGGRGGGYAKPHQTKGMQGHGYAQQNHEASYAGTGTGGGGSVGHGGQRQGNYGGHSGATQQSGYQQGNNQQNYGGSGAGGGQQQQGFGGGKLDQAFGENSLLSCSRANWSCSKSGISATAANL